MDSISHHVNLKKQRSLTPERRILTSTPEERRRSATGRQQSLQSNMREYDHLGKNLSLRIINSSRSSSTDSEEAISAQHRFPANRHQYKGYSNSGRRSNSGMDNGDHRMRRSRWVLIGRREMFFRELIISPFLIHSSPGHYNYQ